VLHEQESPDLESALERLANAGDESVDHELRLALGRLLELVSFAVVGESA
jgi:hypothetical protein